MTATAKKLATDSVASSGSDASVVIDLTHVVSCGAIFDGEIVTEISLKWAGGEMRADLRPPDGETDESAASLKTKVLAKLKASDVALSRKQLGKLLKRKTLGGRYSQVVSALVETGQILERDRLLTDDASKFPDDTCDEVSA